MFLILLIAIFPNYLVSMQRLIERRASMFKMALPTLLRSILLLLTCVILLNQAC